MPKLRSSKSTAAQSSGHRAKIVWLSLVASMTCVGGLLVMMDRSPAPRAGGISLTPLVAAGTTSSIDSIFDAAPSAKPGRWNSIVIHHSGQLAGGPISLETAHRAQGLKGLGHHFVIGNGRGSEMSDGELHLGFRWIDQLPGAHAVGPKGDYYNQNALSICLVGDGNRQRFTKAQLARLNQLVEALRVKLAIPADRVLLSSDISSVKSPGSLFPEAQFKARQLAR
ncbi:MAG: peptidoglycan recognition protein family protein [Phycisphaerales bacterium]|nr:peptidoglycan recognition protein family protein [Phycisphaerales bacterium]